MCRRPRRPNGERFRSLLKTPMGKRRTHEVSMGGEVALPGRLEGRPTKGLVQACSGGGLLVTVVFGKQLRRLALRINA